MKSRGSLGNASKKSVFENSTGILRYKDEFLDICDLQTYLKNYRKQML